MEFHGVCVCVYTKIKKIRGLTDVHAKFSLDVSNMQRSLIELLTGRSKDDGEGNKGVKSNFWVTFS